MKKVEKIRQIVQLKQVMKRWRALSLKSIPPGFFAIYVGPDHRRFLIPTRFLNLPVFVTLLKKSEEEYGFKFNGGIVLPCEVDFFTEVLKFLEKDEQRFGRLELDEFLKMFSEVGFDSSCKKVNHSCHGFTPLLQKARV